MGRAILSPEWGLVDGGSGRLPRAAHWLCRESVPFQGRARQGCLTGRRDILADAEVSNGSGWKQSKQNHSACSVGGQLARAASAASGAVVLRRTVYVFYMEVQ